MTAGQRSRAQVLVPALTFTAAGLALLLAGRVSSPSWIREVAGGAGILLASATGTWMAVRRFEGRGGSPPEGEIDSGWPGLTAAIAQASEAVVITDRDARIRYVNPAFTRMTGYTSEEAVGQNPRILKSGKQNRVFYEQMWKTIRAGQVWRGELVNRRKDGSHYTEETNITPVRNAAGVITNYIAIKQDVTERRQGADAQRLLAAIVESSEDAILTHSPTGEITTWNRGAEALFGYRREEVLGKSVSTVIPPEYPELLDQMIEKVSRGEPLPPFETVAVHKDAQRLDVSVSLSPLRNEAGQVTATAAIVRDIRALRQVVESKLLLASLADSSSDAISMVDFDGTVLNWNKGAERIYGYDAEEIVGKSFLILAGPERRDEMLSLLKRVKRGHGFSQIETVRLAKGGRPVDVSLSLAPIRNASGQIVATSCIARDITAGKRAERELHASEGLFRTAFEHAPFGMVLSAPDGRLLRVNAAFSRMLGYSEQELLARSWDEIRHPGDLAATHAALEGLEDGRCSTVELEQRYLHKEGRIVWARSRVSTVGDVTTSAWHSITHVEDITDRKRSEEAIRASEDRVRLLLDSTAEAIYGIDLEGNCTFANPAALRALGYADVASLLGKNMHDLMHHTRGDGRPYSREDCRIVQAFRLGEGTHVDDEVLWRRDGTSFPAEYWSYPMRKDGQVVGSVVAFLDITERKRTEEALRKSEERYRLLVASIPDCVWISDEMGRCVFITPNIEPIYGYTPEEIYQTRVWFERVHPEDSAYVRDAFVRFLREGVHFRTEYRIQRKDGRWIWMDGRAVSTYELDGQRYTVGLASEITARKEAAEELRKAKEAAEAGSRAKSNFLANMSHEIRTPMNGVIGMTRLLLESDLSAEQRRYAEVVQSSAETLMALINHILDLSKIEAGKMALDQVDFDLRALLEGVVELLAFQAHRKGLELTCLVAPETPSHLRGDPGRLRQVIMNLAANAVKFSAAGEVAIRVEPARDEGPRVVLRFSIADTGIGIPKDRMPALFSPFVQGDESTTRKFGGTGLGLAISRQLVEMMSGEIGFESEEGRGSTFRFTAVLEKQPNRAEPADANAALAHVKVLVADRSRANRLAVSALLAGFGCRASDAAEAGTALALLREAAQAGDPYRIAMIDRNLEGASGEELAGKIAADPGLGGTLLALMTGLGEPEAKAGGSLFAFRIKKPILETRLREALKAALSPRRGVEKPGPVRRVEAGLRPVRRKGRILLAEDNAINQEVALALLGRLGYMVDAVSNGADAVEALKTASYDVVLMDCQMPELDGYEATRLIRQPSTGVRNPQIPIIALTAGAMPGDREARLRAGMNDYIAKPVEPDQLAKKLGAWLTTAPPETEPVFDEAGLLQRLMGDERLAHTIAKQVLEDIPEQLCNLREHLQNGDAGGARRLAHTLKGAAATASAVALKEVAFEAEVAARAGKLQEVAELLPQVEEQLERFRGALLKAGWV